MEVINQLGQAASMKKQDPMGINPTPNDQVTVSGWIVDPQITEELLWLAPGLLSPQSLLSGPITIFKSLGERKGLETSPPGAGEKQWVNTFRI